MTEKKRKNLPWTEDEYKLALIVYQDIKRCGEKISNNNPKIIALSQLLQVLDIYPLYQRGNKFREPDGVRSRVAYFKRMDEGIVLDDRNLQYLVWKIFSKNRCKNRI